MLQITQSSQRDGLTFSLNTKSELTLRQLDPKVRLLPRVFIAFETAGDFQNYRGDLYEQIAQLLTQLSEEELKEKFGGYEVIDPVTGQKYYSNA
jgi:hypothetical protein